MVGESSPSKLIQDGNVSTSPDKKVGEGARVFKKSTKPMETETVDHTK